MCVYTEWNAMLCIIDRTQNYELIHAMWTIFSFLSSSVKANEHSNPSNNYGLN